MITTKRADLGALDPIDIVRITHLAYVDSIDELQLSNHYQKLYHLLP